MREELLKVSPSIEMCLNVETKGFSLNKETEEEKEAANNFLNANLHEPL
jgi:hypothetical protein